MERELYFAVPDNGNIHTIRAGHTLKSFIYYDFTYFWERCLELAHQSQASGQYSWEDAAALREYIKNCHPYMQVLIQRDFEKIALDCMIDFICRWEGIGLEELWVRNITPKDAFGREVFSRISEYKTGNAINQWANLLRMQEYATAKAAFLFDGDLTTLEEYKARNRYYDLAFSLTADAMGYTPDQLSYVRRYNPALMPKAAGTMTRVSKTLGPLVSQMAGDKSTMPPNKQTDCLRDQASGRILTAMLDLPRPGPYEREAVLEALRDLPEHIYYPTSFKAILDLEFDEMLTVGLIFHHPVENQAFAVMEIAQVGGNHTAPAQPAPVAAVAAEEQEAKEPASKTERVSPILERIQRKAQQVQEAQEAQQALLPSAPKAEPLPVEEKPIAVAAVAPTVLTAPTAPTLATPRPPVTPTPKRVGRPPKAKQPDVVPVAPEPPPVQPESKAARPSAIAQMANDPNRTPSGKKATNNINVRNQFIYTLLSKRVGVDLEKAEFDEWSRLLMHICRGIIKKEMSPDDLEKYLDATEEMYSLSEQGE